MGFLFCILFDQLNLWFGLRIFHFGRECCSFYLGVPWMGYCRGCCLQQTYGIDLVLDVCWDGVAFRSKKLLTYQILIPGERLECPGCYKVCCFHLDSWFWEGFFFLSNLTLLICRCWYVLDILASLVLFFLIGNFYFFVILRSSIITLCY